MIRSLVIAVCVGFFSVSAAAADAITMLKSFADKTVSASGRFTQQSESSSEKISGVFAFSRPGKFLWRTDSPFKQTIVSDAKTLWIYDVDLNQVTVRNVKGAIDAGPATLLFGGSNPEQFFNLSVLNEEGDFSWVRAVPKSNDAAFSFVDIAFDAEGLPKKMRLADRFSEKTLYTLEAVRVPSQVDKKVYEFTVPAGADVLRDTSSE